MEFRGFTGVFYKFLEWVSRLSGTNLMWFVFSLPVFYLVFVVAFTAELTREMINQFLIMTAVFSPFTLFPATTAMYAVARQWVMGRLKIRLSQMFWQEFKANYKQSMVGGLVYAAVMLIIMANLLYYSDKTGTIELLAIVFLVLLLFALGSLLYFFPLVTHVQMNTGQILKHTILMMFTLPLRTLMLLAANFVIVYFCYRYLLLMPFFMGSVSAVFTFYVFRHSLSKFEVKIGTFPASSIKPFLPPEDDEENQPNKGDLHKKPLK